MNSRYASRKFLIALTTLIVAHVGLFTSTISGSEWLSAVTLILGIYGAANVGQRAVEK